MIAIAIMGEGASNLDAMMEVDPASVKAQVNSEEVKMKEEELEEDLGVFEILIKIEDQ